MTRTALVIGNAAYLRNPLRNAIADASAMSECLTRLGFSVDLCHNLSLRNLEGAITRFSATSRGGDALCFYAGHAFQISGSVYLVPTDWTTGTEGLMPMGRLLGAMAGASSRIVLLDACRNNPFATAPGGLGRATSPMGSRGCTVLYATQAGGRAEDGVTGHSPFTTALLRHIEAPAMEMVDLYRAVATDLKGTQTPELWMSQPDPFYFTKAVS